MNVPDWMVFALHGIAVFLVAVASYLYLVKEVADALFSKKYPSTTKNGSQAKN
ncbi:hypothetical protein [Uliginosibacterium gangwonense]|uniref:hypothetical protein n=1 Tax=Uliginosibacterium gangwonense TaxID=392736 RepID=UPI0003A33E29|nr:hypothetical protein [Uliginosibacterium gangwonense]